MEKKYMPIVCLARLLIPPLAEEPTVHFPAKPPLLYPFLGILCILTKIAYTSLINKLMPAFTT